MVGILRKLKEKVSKSSDKNDRAQQTHTSAGAGLQARSPDEQKTSAQTETSRKIVVVGKESVFSQEIIDYALEMAERMSYGIVALNAAPLHCDTFKLFSEPFQKICDDFEALSNENVKEFRKRAEDKGIRFAHIIKFNDSYEVLKEIKDEIGEFEFVVSEMEGSEIASGSKPGESAKRKIFVYSIM